MSVLLNEMTSGEREPADENSNAMANERRRLIDENPHVRVDIEPIKLNVNKSKARSLRIIDEDPEKKLILQNWETERSEKSKKIDTKSTDIVAITADLYQFIGIYTAFQGVIITAVALSSTLSCKISWAPGLLSLFASVVTLASVYFKLDYYHQQKNIVHNWIIGEQELIAKIEDFKFNADIPDEKYVDIRYKRKHKENLRELRQKFETALTLMILAIFSLFVFGSCFVMLCPKLR